MASGEVDLQADLDKHRRAVDTEYFDLSVRELVRMVESEEIVVAPSYQRKFRWPQAIQSALIESLLLGLPIPALFVATNRDGTWDVVDGLQRIATLLRFHGIDVPKSAELRFADSPLVLDELTQLKSFNNHAYSDLPNPLKLMFGKRYLRVQVLSDKSDADIRLELFRRLNAGAVALSRQEIRSAVFLGPYNGLLEELAELPEFKALLKLEPKDQNDGTATEVVLKFFAYLARMDEFDGKVAKFLDEYMKSRANETNLEPDRKLFESVVKHLHGVLDGAVFKRPTTPTTPINQLEGVMVGLGRIFRNGETPQPPPEDWINDKKLVDSSTKGTNSRSMLRGRVLRSEELFSGKA